jgi:DNA-binding transcriptional regulator LsrR (DeoR family)
MVNKYQPKLTEAQRKEVAKIYLTTDIKQTDLAKEYNISHTSIQKYVKKYKEEILNEE